MAQYPDANINTIANLIRLDMPVNSENIAMFEAYKNFDAQINGQLNSLGLDIYNSINNADDLTDIRNLINGMYGTGDSEVASENLGKAFF